MKILYLADLHYSLKQLDWVVSQRGNFNLILIGGDLLDMGGFLERDAQAIVVEKYFQKLAPEVTLGVVSGNHDFDRDVDDEKLTDWLSVCREHGMKVDGDTFMMDRTQIVLLPWVNGPITRGQAEAQLNAAAGQEADFRLWAYHEPPDASPVSWNGKRHLGSHLLPEWIDVWKPDLVVGGHVHNAPFYAEGDWKAQVGTTWVFNPGKQIGDVPAVIEFDLEARSAIWNSLEGSESLSL